MSKKKVSKALPRPVKAALPRPVKAWVLVLGDSPQMYRCHTGLPVLYKTKNKAMGQFGEHEPWRVVHVEITPLTPATGKKKGGKGG